MPTDSVTRNEPLVSIICRSMGRAHLAEALSSVAKQTHSPVEVILVNAGSTDLSSFIGQQSALHIRELQGNGKLNRSEAANLGMAAASGEFFLFLDDDDWISLDHVANLLAVLQQDTTIDAVYSGTRKTTEDGTLLDEFFRQDYDPALLLRDNFIPIHSVLFRRELFDRGCRFDTAFVIYEDWDFWLQVSEHTAFRFIDDTTAFYRAGGDSETAQQDVSLRYQEGHMLAEARAQLFDKWLAKWSGAKLNQLLGSMDRQQQFDIAYLQKLLQQTRQDIANKEIDIAYLQKLLQQTRQDIANKEIDIAYLQKLLQQTRQDIANKEIDIAYLQKLLQQTRQDIANKEIDIAHLQEAHRLIEQSVFWRITAPLRYLRDRLFALAKPQTATPEMPPSIAKKIHDDSATASLAAFLDSKQRLTFASTDHPEISIVLVFYNQAHLSFLCLQSIITHGDVSYEVIIVNNHSTDQTSRLLERIDNAKLLCNETNMGFVKAVNQAASVASGKHLLLLNNDAMLEAASLSTALRTLQSSPNIGAVGARIKLLDGTLQEAGSIIWQDGSCTGYGRGDDPAAFPYLMQRDVDYCSGAFLLLETAVFRRLHGFDEDFAPAYYEESDFCIRLRQQGYRTVYAPGAQITHYEFASSGGAKAAGTLQQQHRAILCAKHTAYLQQQQPNTAANLLRARTANNYPNVLIIDDRVPFPSLGAGYPRCASILHTLAAADVNLTFYPLQFPTDDWQSVYRVLAPVIEVAMGLGRTGLADFLRQRRGFYQIIMVSRIHNMAWFNQIVSQCPALLGEAELIYDAEAVYAAREILHRRLQGEQISRSQERAEIAEELAQARSAKKVVTVSAQEAALCQQYGIEQTLVLGHQLSAQPTENAFSQRSGLLFVGALRDKESPMWTRCDGSCSIAFR